MLAAPPASVFFSFSAWAFGFAPESPFLRPPDKTRRCVYSSLVNKVNFKVYRDGRCGKGGELSAAVKSGPLNRLGRDGVWL